MADYFEERGINANVRESAEEMNRRLLEDLTGLSLSHLTMPHLFEESLPPPASSSVVNDLPEEKIAEKRGECQICLKEYEKDEVVKKMPCKHSFHLTCLMAWLSKTNSCPLCRYELPTDNEDYEKYRKEKIRARQREVEIADLHNSMFT